MSALTIRDLDDDLYQRLSAEAALQGRSVEEEAQFILPGELMRRQRLALARRIHCRFVVLGGVDLDVPPRAELPKDNWPGDDCMDDSGSEPRDGRST